MTTLTSGACCPVSGLWETVGNPSTTILICKGEPMPDYLGKTVQWQLIKKDSEGQDYTRDPTDGSSGIKADPTD